MMEGLTCLGAIDKARPMLLFHYFSARTLIRAAQEDKQTVVHLARSKAHGGTRAAPEAARACGCTCLGAGLGPGIDGAWVPWPHKTIVRLGHHIQCQMAPSVERHAQRSAAKVTWRGKS